MNKNQTARLLFSLVALGVAGFFLYRHFSADDGISDQAFFYDLSERQLFEAPRSAVPPIQGINDEIEDGVSAVVISTTGDPKDKSSWKIAYLEKYAPELKRDLEHAQQTGEASRIGRGLAQQMRFVRSESDTNWHAMATPEGERIISAWAVPGPNGITPVVCTP